MKQQFCSQWKLHANSLWGLLLTAFGVFVAGDFLVVVVLSFNKLPDSTYLSVGGILALVAVAIYALFEGIYNYTMRYDLALSMGCTRRNYLIGVTGMGITRVWLATLWAIAVGNLSTLVHRLFFAHIPLEEGFYGVITPFWLMRYGWAFALGGAGIVLFSMCCAALIKRFSRNVLWIFWALYMGIILFGDRFAKTLQNAAPASILGRISALFASVPFAAYALLGIALFVALLVYSTRVLLRARVAY